MLEKRWPRRTTPKNVSNHNHHKESRRIESVQFSSWGRRRSRSIGRGGVEANGAAIILPRIGRIAMAVSHVSFVYPKSLAHHWTRRRSLCTVFLATHIPCETTLLPFIGRHQEPQFIFSIIENEGAYEYSLLNNSNNNIQKRRAKPVSCRLFLFHSLIEFEVATKMRIRAFTSQNISPLSAAVRERDLRSVTLSNRAE